MKFSPSHRPKQSLRFWLKISGIMLFAILGIGIYYAYPWLRTHGNRMTRLVEWLRQPQAHPEWAVQAGERCGQAPFLLPTNGYIGFLWGDSFRLGHRHQGIDIFGGEDAGTTPVLAASSGYLTRLAEWKSSLIIRIPEDPLHSGRQIWIYYTHLADEQGNSFISSEFPPGTIELYVEAGALLGYQGNYSGTPGNPTGIHLHFSIVLDDGQGKFRNELDIRNTLDPSGYLGIALNVDQKSNQVPTCWTQR